MGLETVTGNGGVFLPASTLWQDQCLNGFSDYNLLCCTSKRFCGAVVRCY